MRLQSGIAKASQRDSEDMKFIAVLGSVFLPAGLVAVGLAWLEISSDRVLTIAMKSILNVQAWQFLPGPQLFGAYIAITAPLVALTIIICFSRPYWKRYASKFLQTNSKKPLPRQNSLLRKMGTF